MNFNLIHCFLVVIFFCLSQTVIAIDKLEQLRSSQLPPCRACKVIVESFKKGMQKTAKGKFEGGDAAWEEAKLGNYATSEIRLIEIQELLCRDVEEGRDQCFSLIEEHDSTLEEWWFKKQTEEPNLFKWLCIDKLQYCCPDEHYGPECLPCLGYPGNVCNKNGKCKGAGTRKGNGMCICDVGYEGDNCTECAVNYYEAYRDELKLLCSKCHQSCAGGCTKAGNQGCMDCAAGYIKDSDRGCLDINECAFDKPVCKNSQFCVNTDGSFSCLECDRACVGCIGDGPDMCNKCASDFTLIDNVCVDSSQWQRTSYVMFTRYLTYIGLCIATCIILQRSVTVAAIVGLAVALYISVSEYMLAQNSLGNQTESMIDAESLLNSLK